MTLPYEEKKKGKVIIEQKSYSQYFLSILSLSKLSIYL